MSDKKAEKELEKLDAEIAVLQATLNKINEDIKHNIEMRKNDTLRVRIAVFTAVVGLLAASTAVIGLFFTQ